MQSADQLTIPQRSLELTETATRRVLVLDGAMGTMIQSAGLGESDFRGQQSPTIHRPSRGLTTYS